MPNMDDMELAARVGEQLEDQYMTTKAEVVEYYREQHGVNWTSYAAADLAGTTDRKSLAYKSAIRQFQGGRADREAKTADVKAKFAELGKQLPPTGKKPPTSVKVTFSGRVKVSEGRRKGQKGDKNRPLRGDGWSRFSTTQTLTGADALDPSFFALFSEYFTNFDENPVTDYEISGMDIEVSYA
jgi:hypothetical protein